MKDFHLTDILSITTGKLVSTRHMSGIYDILSYMTGDNLYTHQLPRASAQCRPLLLGQYPEFGAINVPEGLTDDGLRARWIAEQIERFGEYLPVSPVPAAHRIIKDPLQELQEMRPDAEIFVYEGP